MGSMLYCAWAIITTIKAQNQKASKSKILNVWFGFVYVALMFVNGNHIIIPTLDIRCTPLSSAV